MPRTCALGFEHSPVDETKPMITMVYAYKQIIRGSLPLLCSTTAFGIIIYGNHFLLFFAGVQELQ